MCTSTFAPNDVDKKNLSHHVLATSLKLSGFLSTQTLLFIVEPRIKPSQLFSKLKIRKALDLDKQEQT
jgi:hypothetical protein